MVVRGAEGATLFEGPAAEYQPPEAGTVALSIEFFNDPEPCEIHRSAVRSRAIQQLQECCPADTDLPVRSLDRVLRMMFADEAETVRITQATPGAGRQDHHKH